MGLPIVQTSVARKDMVDIADYLSIQNVDVGFRFYDCVDQSLLRLSDMPEMGTLCRFELAQASNVRVWTIQGFSNYLIFYRVEDDRLRVLRVLHGSTNYEMYFQDS